MLVWSEAWSAEGEEGETDRCLKHTLTGDCVPANPIVSCANARKSSIRPGLKVAPKNSVQITEQYEPPSAGL
jgi:hypothetical protein